MSELTTDTSLTILINWLQDNIDCESEIIFDKDEDNTDSAVLLPWIQLALIRGEVVPSATDVTAHSGNGYGGSN